MLEISIPGNQTFQLSHLVLDYNGTLAVDGVLIPGVERRLNDLAKLLHIHVVTADTFGAARKQLAKITCELRILSAENQDIGKLHYIEKLGCKNTVCIGNGFNDRKMLKAAELGICVILEEGAAIPTLLSADVVCPSILDALDLLSHPVRLKATLRS